MRRLVAWTISVALGVAVAAVAVPAVAADRRAPLRATNWVLTDRVSIGTPLEHVTVNAVFDGTRVAGSSGCNGYSRSYTTDGSRITIANDGVTTQMFCEGAGSKVERSYLAALDRVGRWRIRGTTLTLSTRAGKRLLVFRASVGEAALRGTWEATAFFTGTAVSSPIPGTTLTLELASGAASGDGGCNTFHGPVSLSGVDGIHLGPFTTTLRACADDAQTTQEQQYLAALGLAETYRVTGDTLILSRDGQTIVANFQRQR